MGLVVLQGVDFFIIIPHSLRTEVRVRIAKTQIDDGLLNEPLWFKTRTLVNFRIYRL